jgi:heme-binding protein
MTRLPLLALTAVAAPLVALGAAVTAAAEPPPPPPNCTAADLAGVMTGVAASTSAYLFTHPEVNDFFTSLRDKSDDEKRTAVTDYMTAHPQTADELRGIRQPSVDFRNRCG